MSTQIQTDPETTDISAELQELRRIVVQVIRTIGKADQPSASELTDPSRALRRLEQFERLQQLQAAITEIFEHLQLPEIPLSILIRTFEYAEPACWQGTFTDFVSAARAGLESFSSQTEQLRRFDESVDRRQRALWRYEDQLRKVEQLREELEDDEGEQWKKSDES